jgi:ubiquitin-protein ligase
MRMAINKRVVRDINVLHKEPLHNIGIYHIASDVNINNLKVLIIGPKDTPYYGGFMFFNITFPENYPMSPPIVKFATLNTHVRFNPNLYNCGKVCLSIINTWAGPGWSPCNDIASILRIILSMVFIEYPLQNEPGYDNKHIDILKQYNDILYHEVYRVAIVEVLENIPRGFDGFIPIINKHFVENYNIYLENAEKLQDIYDNSIIRSPIYGMKFKCNYNHIIYKLKNIYKKLNKLYINSELMERKENEDLLDSSGELVGHINNLTISPIIIPVQSQLNDINNLTIPDTIENINYNLKKKTRKIPNELAKSHQVGYEHVSINDGNMYRVKQRSNGVHYWSRK